MSEVLNMNRPIFARVPRCTYGVALFILLSACGARTDYLISGLDVERHGWDTLEVRLNFARRTALGRTSPIESGETTVTLFDGRYDTLFHGTGTIAVVPDAELSSLEPYIVEVCGSLRGQPVCDQRGLTASPKRVHLNPVIDFPLDKDYHQGRYNLEVVVERRQFEGEDWEVVEAGRDVRGHFLAYVAESGAKPVRVPFQKASGRFDLSKHDHFRDLIYDVKSALKDGRDAVVRFDVYAGTGQEVRLLASDQKRIHLKTDDERSAEVAYYVKAAVEEIANRMRISEHLVVFVDSWRFDSFRVRYTVHVDIHLGDRFFRNDRLEGTLEFSELGGDATFRLDEGHGRMRRLWRDRVDERTVTVGSLIPFIAEGTIPEEETHPDP